MNSILCRFNSRRNERGIAAVEFALTAPVFILLFLGMADATNLLVVSEKVDRTTYTVTDLVTQSETISLSDLDTIALAAKELMNPYDFTTGGVVIVSSLYKPTNSTTRIMWQYTGGGGLARGSKIGSVGSAPSLPAGMTLNDNDNVIVAEVYYAYTPIFINAGIFSASDLYHVAFYKPRLTSLIATPQ